MDVILLIMLWMYVFRAFTLVITSLWIFCATLQDSHIWIFRSLQTSLTAFRSDPGHRRKLTVS